MVVGSSTANPCIAGAAQSGLSETRRACLRALERKVYGVPREIDLEIARLKLASMGVQID